MTTPTYICTFEDGDPANKMLLGGKGANLCAMTQIGLNVPPGFIITTAACLAYLEANRLPDDLMAGVRANIAALERKTGKRFGGADEPAARVRALRLGDVDAGDDGHDPQPRPQRGDAAGRDPRDRRIRGSRTTRTGASSSCSARSRWACPTRSSIAR